MQFVFGDCVLDLERRELIRDAQAVAMGPQVFDLLVFLVENRARVVSKDDVLDTVWKGRIVSESTLTSHINAVRNAIGDSGQTQHLLRTVPRKGFRFVGDVSEKQPSGRSDPVRAEPASTGDALAAAPPLSDTPSLAVLPFQNLSGDPEQDYFADGMIEDVITALSRIRWLLVIARNSSFTYKGRTVDVKQVGRRARRCATCWRAACARRRTVYASRRGSSSTQRRAGTFGADRFDGTLDDIFELQDQVTASVVGTLTPSSSGRNRARQAEADREPSAYDCYLRGIASLHQGSKEAVEEALPLFRRAIELDPDFASAYGMAAWCYLWRKINGSITDRTQEIAEGTRLARRAVELGRDDAIALTRAGSALSHFVDDVDGSIVLLDRALALNPNLTSAWLVGGFLRVWHGEPDAAVEYFARAMRLSPLDPETYRMQAGMAAAHLLARRFETASSWAAKSLGRMPNFLLAVTIITASHALAGQMDEARRAMQHLRRLDPKFGISHLRESCSDPTAGRSHHVRGWPAKSRAAGVSCISSSVAPVA